MKVLIIGSNGFIGKFLSRKLIEDGYEVAEMDVCTPDDNGNGYNFFLGDISNLEDIMQAASAVDVIINLAAKHHDFGVSRKEFFAVNARGTQNILDCAARLGIKKFIFFSTVAVYGNHQACFTEETLPNPVSVYGQSKLEAEKLIHHWAAQDTSREGLIIRPAVVFGPQNYANTYKLIDSIFKRRFLFVGKGDNIKSVAYVENLVDATVFLLERMHPGTAVYNYSDYPQMTIAQTVNTITRYLPCNIPSLRLPLAPAIIFASIFDLLGKLTGHNFPITALRIKKFNTPTNFKADKIRALEFKQKVSLSEGFQRMTEWYLGQHRL